VAVVGLSGELMPHHHNDGEEGFGSDMSKRDPRHCFSLGERGVAMV
jgi:hypothetical protein